MDATRKPPSLRTLSLRVAVVIAVIVGAAGAVYLVWCDGAEQCEVETKVLAEARTLNKQMTAAWDYIDDAQTAINTDKDGSYDFKNVYCAVAGKGIARRFTQTSDGYVIRYVRENPRTGADAPDGFEQRALNHFTVGGSSEYYEMSEANGAPVLMLTAKGDIVDKKIGFHAGADDYMVKPFNDEELLLRIEALLRRRGRGEGATPSAVGQTVVVGAMTTDPRRCEVAVGGRVVALTPKEFQIVATMAESPGKVFTREDLIELVWGREYDAASVSIPVYIRRIREKVEADPSNPLYVQTVWGFGYRLGGE